MCIRDSFGTAPLIRASNWRTTTHSLLNRPSESPRGRQLRIATHIVILISTLCFVLESVPAIENTPFWTVFDSTVAVVFTVEYVLRIYVAPDGRGDEEYDENGTRPMPASPLIARLRTMGAPMCLIDLAAILPFWLGLVLPFAAPLVLQLLRALRL